MRISDWSSDVCSSDLPDIIITDINMPGMDGYAVLQYLQAAPETARIPVLALTSDVMPEAVMRGHAAGFAIYLTKPVDPAALFQGIDRLLRSREICASVRPLPHRQIGRRSRRER